MRLSRTALATLMLNHVVELRFRRRILKEGYNTQRRMLCTNDRLLLNSTPGKSVLNYAPPSGRLRYDPNQKNLLIVWDIFMQQYRAVPCESVDVVSVIRSTPPDDFWKYFQESILPMQAQGKANIMNK